MPKGTCAYNDGLATTSRVRASAWACTLKVGRAPLCILDVVLNYPPAMRCTMVRDAKSHTIMSAVNPMYVIWPLARKRPSALRVRHDISS
jgi:hypothetical protein